MLHHVGIAASFKQASARSSPRSWRRCARTRATTIRGATGPTCQDAEAGRSAHAGRAPSRWNRGKDLSWEPLRIELVGEVAYDHLQGDRFRHATHFVRWRPDKPPADCRYDQLEERPAAELAKLFGSDATP